MMQLIERMNAAIPMGLELAFFVRIVCACICGAAVGFERSKRFKEAGIRTHCMVACTAAVFMILSKYCFADLAGDYGMASFGERGADPARIAAQIVCGIGFLGAGVIFKNGNSIKGLTTAAGIWATAAIGMAIGSGMYWIGGFTTALVVALQVLMHKFTVGSDAYSTNRITIVAKDSPDFRVWLTTRFEQWGIQVEESSVARNGDGTATYKMTLRATNCLDFNTLLSLMDEKEEILSASFRGE